MNHDGGRGRARRDRHLVLSGGQFGSDSDRARVGDLEDELAEAIEAGGVGEYDGNDFGEGEAVLYMYGPNADTLFKTVEPLLRAFAPLPGSHVIKQFGSGDDQAAAEEIVPLA